MRELNRSIKITTTGRRVIKDITKLQRIKLEQIEVEQPGTGQEEEGDKFFLSKSLEEELPGSMPTIVSLNRC